MRHRRTPNDPTRIFYAAAIFPLLSGTIDPDHHCPSLTPSQGFLHREPTPDASQFALVGAPDCRYSSDRQSPCQKHTAHRRYIQNYRYTQAPRRSSGRSKAHTRFSFPAQPAMLPAPIAHGVRNGTWHSNVFPTLHWTISCNVPPWPERRRRPAQLERFAQKKLNAMTVQSVTQ